MPHKIRVVGAGDPILQPRPTKQPPSSPAPRQRTPKKYPDNLVSKDVQYGGEQEELLCQIEGRYKEVAYLNGDLTVSRIEKEKGMQAVTTKEKSDEHGQVFTPLWLVDEMLDNIRPKDWYRQDALTTFDLCSGYGQFSIRMLRRRYEYKGEALNIPLILSDYHLFAEIQPASCFCLLYTFGTQIRLLIGDATKMGELPDSAERGIWVYNKGRWEDRTKLVTALYNKYMAGGGTITERAGVFEKKFNSLKRLCENRRA